MFFRKTVILFLLLFGCRHFAADFTLDKVPPDSPGWVFRPGQEIAVLYQSDTELSEKIQIKVTDLRGQSSIVTGERIGERQARFLLPTNRNGYFTLAAEKATRRYAIIPEPDPERDTLANPFGINFHLDRVPLAEGAREIAFARYIGIDWGRSMMVDWSDLNSPDYERELERYDGLFRLAENSGLHVLGRIFYIPRFASGRPDEEYLVWSRTPSENPDLPEVTRYATFIARKYPFIRHWEIGNEQDHELFWRGRKSSTGNSKLIIRDYVDFLAAANRGLKAGAPESKTVFGGLTSGGPLGSTYQPFLATALEYDARKHCDLLGAHYSSSVPEIKKHLRDRNLPDAAVWFTEIGESAGGTSYNEIAQLRSDLLQMVEQLTDGAEKVFKYNLRNDGFNPDDREHHFGMITRDFQPKPNYVSNATMIRLLQRVNANRRRINVLDCVSHGYLKGFEFDLGERKINVLVLEGAPTASVNLKAAETQYTLIDAMGEERPLAAVNGVLNFEIDTLPVFLIGELKTPPGEVRYPTDKMICKRPLKLGNSSFSSNLSGWYPGIDKETTTISRQVEEETENGFLRLVSTAPGGKNYHGVSMLLDEDIGQLLRQLTPRQYLRINISARVRHRGLDNRGAAFTCELLEPGTHQRFAWYETAFSNGDLPWTTWTVSGEIVPRTGSIRLALFLAPGTTGELDFDDVKAELEVWQRPFTGKGAL